MQGEAERALRCRPPPLPNRPHFDADSIDSAIPRPLAGRQRDYDRTRPLARGFDGELELELGTLKVTNHFEQIAGLRIPVRTEHAHQAFVGRFVTRLSSSNPIVALM